MNFKILDKEAKDNVEIGGKCQNKKNNDRIIVQVMKYFYPLYKFMIFHLIILTFIILSSLDALKNDGSSFAIVLFILIIMFFVSIISTILSLILSKINIKKNYNNLQISNGAKTSINLVNSIFLYCIIIFSISIIISLIFRFVCQSNWYEYIFFFCVIALGVILTPVLIPIIKFFNKDNYVSKDSVNRIILVSYVLCVWLIISGIFSIFTVVLVSMIPIFVIGLQNDSNQVKNTEKKDIIYSVILLLVLVALICTFIFLLI